MSLRSTSDRQTSQMAEPEEQPSLRVDEDFVENAPEHDDFDDSRTVSSRRTMATTTTMFRYENGRTYHAYREGSYMQPNDTKANNHEAIVHHLCILMLQDKLFLAPIGPNPKHILDVGTGTGIWAIDMADKFPDATITGTDLSRVPPGIQPPNCEFIIDDCASDWVFAEDHFDLVHIRGLYGSISDWPRLYQQAYSHLAPGGWIEHVEWSVRIQSADGPMLDDEVLSRWAQHFYRIGDISGKNFIIAETMTDMIRDAGFQDLVETRYKWPIGPWAKNQHMKEMGRWNLLNWEEGMEGWILAPYTRVLGWSAADVQDWLTEVRSTLRDRQSHFYHEVHIVYARKPPT